MKRSTPFKFFTANLALILFVNNGVLASTYEANIWSERKKNLTFPLQVASASFPVSNKTGIDVPGLSRLGRLDVPAAISFSKKKPTVLHIHDVHMNAEAQNNIARAVEQLMNTKAVDAIALEGAVGPIDLERFRRYRRPELIRLVSSYLLEKNKISGPIFAALTGRGEPPKIIGVDDPAHYRANVDAFRRAAPLKNKTRSALSSLERKLEEEKFHILNPRLLAFHETVALYRDRKTSLRDYIHRIAADPKRLPASLRLFLETLDLESELKLEEVERERTALLERVMPRLERKESVDLLHLGTLCGLGREPYSRFYGRLMALALQSGVSINRYPNLQLYTRYLRQADNLNIPAVISELDEFEKLIYASKIESKEEAAWVAKHRWLHLAGKLVEFSLTRDEWEEYCRGEPVARPRAREVGRSTDSPLQPFEDFYLEAIVRDEKMAENLIKNAPRSAVLVTGGFHANGIDERLKAAGFDVVTFTPKISRIDTESGSRYLNAFLQARTPLDKLFQGDRLFMAFPPADGVREIPPVVTALSGNPADFSELSPVGTATICERTDFIPPDTCLSQAGGVETRVQLKEGNVRINYRMVKDFRFWSQVTEASGLLMMIQAWIPSRVFSIDMFQEKSFKSSAFLTQNPLWVGLLENWHYVFFGVIVLCFIYWIAHREFRGSSIFSLGRFKRDENNSFLRTTSGANGAADVTRTTLFQLASEMRQVNSLDELHALIQTVSGQNLREQDRKKHRAVICPGSFQNALEFPLSVSLIPQELAMEDFGTSFRAVLSLFELQKDMGIIETGKWRPFFRIVDDDSSVIYLLYHQNQSEPEIFVGEKPAPEKLRDASTIVVSVPERAFKPNRRGFEAGVLQAQDPNQNTQLQIEKLVKVADYLRMTYQGIHYEWYLIANNRPFFPPETAAKTDDWPMQMVANRTDDTVHQREIGSSDNLEDLFGLLAALNGESMEIAAGQKAERRLLAQLAAKTIECMTDKGDSFNAIIAPAGPSEGKGFRVGLNGSEHPLKKGVDPSIGNTEPGNVTGAASQSNAHAQIMRFPFPIEKARTQKVFEHQGVNVSYVEPRYRLTFLGFETRVYHPVGMVMLEFMGAILCFFSPEQSWITKEVTCFLLETSQLRMFIGDRIKSQVVKKEGTDAKETKFTNTFGFPESIGKVIINDKVATLFDLGTNNQILIDLREGERQVAQIKTWIKTVREVFRKPHTDLISDYNATRLELLAGWEDMKKIAQALRMFVAPQRKALARGVWHHLTAKLGSWYRRFWLTIDYWYFDTFQSRKGPSYIKGYTYKHDLNVEQGGRIPCHRTGLQVSQYLKSLSDQPLEQRYSVQIPYPLFDGGTSAFDMKEYQALFDRYSTWGWDLPGSISPVSEDIWITLRFEPSEDPDAIEYDRQDRTMVYYPDQATNGDPVPYIMKEFGIDKGVRVICEINSHLPDWGGLEGSGIFNYALISGLSVLAGADLSENQIVHHSIDLENDVFNGITGGRGQLSASVGGVHEILWLEFPGENRRRPFLTPLFQEDQQSQHYEEIHDHFALVQAGVSYRNGALVTPRWALVINQMWIDVLENNIKGHLFDEMKRLSVLYRHVLRSSNYKIVVRILMRFVEIRDEICREWMRIVIEGIDEKAPKGFRDIYKRVFEEKNNPFYKKYEIIREIYKKGEEEFLNTSLYTYGEIGDLVERAKREGIALMPTGAGGPHSNLAAACSQPWIRGKLQRFLSQNKIELYAPDKVQRAIFDTTTFANQGTPSDPIKTFARINIGNNTRRYTGLGEDMREPSRPLLGMYNQKTGQYVDIGEQVGTPEQVRAVENDLNLDKSASQHPITFDSEVLENHAANFVQHLREIRSKNQPITPALVSAVVELPFKLDIASAVEGSGTSGKNVSFSLSQCAAEKDFLDNVQALVEKQDNINAMNESDAMVVLQEMELRALEKYDLEQLSDMQSIPSALIMPISTMQQAMHIAQIMKSLHASRVLLLIPENMKLEINKMFGGGGMKGWEVVDYDTGLFSKDKLKLSLRRLWMELPDETKHNLSSACLVLSRGVTIDPSGVEDVKHLSGLKILFIEITEKYGAHAVIMVYENVKGLFNLLKCLRGA